jgi:hypothetical protein
MTNELQTYIASLKPGDVFWVDTSQYSRVSGYRDTVERITPTGRIVGKRDTFLSDGRMVGGGYYCHRCIALPAFNEKVAAYLREERVANWKPAQVQATETNIDRVEAAQRAYDAAIREIKA